MRLRLKRGALLAGLLAAGLVPAWSLDLFGWADRWSGDERAVLATLQLRTLSAPAADPSNAVEGHAAAAALGKKLFFDPRLSANGEVSCASCHDPRRQFQDGLPLGRGIALGARRSMPVVEAGRSPFLFWDGRKDSLWAQALGPLEDPKEHGSNRLRLVHLLQQFYRADYEKLFPPMPDLRGLPLDASPLGSPAERAAWEGIGAERRQKISAVFANGGKALAAYQKTLTYGPSRMDRYIGATLAGKAGATDLFTAPEKRGLRLFINKGQCVTCHNGPLLTDQSFHNTGVASRDPRFPDLGRAQAVPQVKADEFNCAGPFSAAPGQCDELRFIAASDPASLGAFKTPGLRNVALRAPYMHAGTLDNLTAVVQHYAKAPAAAVGKNERAPLRLSEQEIGDLVAFLKTLSGPILENGAPLASP